MSITSITIENFKGIKDKVKIDLKPITLLFGPNSAGKSTIIQALHYLKQIFVNRNTDADVSFAYDGNIRFNGFQNLVYNHDLKNVIKLGIEINRKPLTDTKIESGGWLSYNELIKYEDKIYMKLSVIWNDSKNCAQVNYLALYIDNIKVIAVEYDINSEDVFLVYFDHKHRIFSKIMNYDPDEPPWAFYDSNAKIRRYPYNLYFQEILTKYFNHENNKYNYQLFINPSEKNDKHFPVLREVMLYECMSYEYHEERGFHYYEEDRNFFYFRVEILDKLILESFTLIRDELVDFLRIGPLREMPDRIEANQMPSQQRFITGKAAWDILYSADETFIEKFNHWISSEDKFSTGYSAYQKNIVEIDKKKLPEDITIEYIASLPSTKKLIFKDSNDVEVMPQDVGFGFSQILPVVVAALMRENETRHLYHGSKEHKKIISIEQPELHIHPKLQVELGDLFIEQSVNKNVIFLIETHSEHLMLRLLRRIRETSEGKVTKNLSLSPPEVAIYFIEPYEGGISCTKIRINEDGEFIDRWPQGFFGERFEELY